MNYGIRKNFTLDKQSITDLEVLADYYTRDGNQSETIRILIEEAMETLSEELEENV